MSFQVITFLWSEDEYTLQSSEFVQLLSIDPIQWEGRQNGNHSYRKLTNWSLGSQPCLLSESVSLAVWGHPRLTGNGGDFQQNVVHWRREWLTTSVFCLENPMNGMKMQKDMMLKDELPRSVGAQYATGEEWRKGSRKKQEMESKWKQGPAVDETGDGSKVWCCKEQCCIGT